MSGSFSSVGKVFGVMGRDGLWNWIPLSLKNDPIPILSSMPLSSYQSRSIHFER